MKPKSLLHSIAMLAGLGDAAPQQDQSNTKYLREVILPPRPLPSSVFIPTGRPMAYASPPHNQRKARAARRARYAAGVRRSIAFARS